MHPSIHIHNNVESEKQVLGGSVSVSMSIPISTQYSVIMVNFMFHLGQAMILRYLVKHPRYFCKSTFQMRLTFKSVDTEKGRMLSIIWVGLLCAAEGLHSKRRTFQEEEGILPADCLWSQTPTLSQVSNLLAQPAEFGLVNTSQLHRPHS